MERRLAAILAADVVGYSRMIRADEEGTLLALRALREELIDPKIREHRGRIVKLMGDGILVEFASVVDAVACSAEVQQSLAERDAGGPQIVFRVGINLGDVVIDGEDIHGDGVNVASRLEALSEPGGMCISDAVHDQVRDRLDLEFEDAGKQEVKNIDRPVQAWKWSASGSASDSSANGDAGPSSWTQPLPLPDKPSIAVLPFENMSTDPEHEFFADGITEDIITTLSKISKLFVIARNSTLIYKGRAIDVKQVGREQGVQYVLEGSVRWGGMRVRITTQLIEAATGHHLWGQRYDRQVSDIFAVQDEITKEVVSAIQIELTEGEQAALLARGTDNLEAWQLTFQARNLLHEHHQEGVRKARHLVDQALRLDEKYFLAWGVLAGCHWTEALNEGWSASRERSLELALEANDRSLALAPSQPMVLIMRGLILLAYREFDAALEFVESATHSVQGQANALATGAIVLLACGKPEEAIKHINKAMRLCPVYPAWYLWLQGAAHWALGQSEESIAAARLAIERDPDFSYAFVLLAMVYAETQRDVEAQNAVAEVLRTNPDFSLTTWAKGMPYHTPELESRQLAALRKSGLPE